MKVVRKPIMMVFAFISLFAIGFLRVSARTVTVNDDENLHKALMGIESYEDVTEIKLGTDIIKERQYIINVNGRNLVFDLNGNKLQAPESAMTINYSYNYSGQAYTNNGSLTFKDSSASKTGKMLTKYINVGNEYTLSEEEKAKNPKEYTLTFDGGSYAFSNEYLISLFKKAEDSNGYNITLNVNILKGLFEVTKSDAVLFDLAKLNDNDTKVKFNLKNLTLKGQKVKIGNKRLADMPFNTVVPETTKIYYNAPNGDKKELIDKTTMIDSVFGNNEALGAEKEGYIKLVSNALVVDDVNLTEEFGFEQATPKNITIRNADSNPIQIKSVTVVDADKFEIVGASTPTIDASGLNTDFTIQAKGILAAGVYKTTLKVTDMDENEYTANITLEVTKKDISATIGITMDNWTYGEVAKEASLTGVDNLQFEDYELIYTKIGSSEALGFKPATAGNYKVKLLIKGNNYVATSKEAEFTILPTEKVVKIVANTSSKVYDGQEYRDNTYTVYFDDLIKADRKLLNEDKVTKVTVNGVVTDVADNTALNNIVDKDSILIDNMESYKNIVVEAGTISIKPIDTPIIVTANSSNKKYDDTELTNEEYTYTEGVLIAGDKLTATIKGSQKYVGSSKNKVENVVVTRGEKDITANYTFGLPVEGDLNVEETEQNISVDNLNIKVNGNISLETLTKAVKGAMGTVTFEKVSGEGNFDEGTGFTAGGVTGSATMKVKVTAKDINGDLVNEYKEASHNFTINIVDKYEVIISGLNDNEELPYTGQALMPTGKLKVSDSNINADELEVLYEGTGSTVYNSKDAPVNVGDYKVTYKVADTNPDYVGTKSYTFKIVKAKLNKVSLETDSFGYTKEEITVVLNDFNEEIMTSSGNKSEINVGSYMVTISLKDKNNYEWNDGTTTDLSLPWSINKVDPLFIIPEGLTGIKGQKLKDIALDGRYTWDNPEMDLTVGKHEYKATFTPEDTVNYNTITDIDIMVDTKDLFDVNTSVDGGNGTISESLTKVLEGKTEVITFTPDEGYMINKVLVNTKEVEVNNNKLSLVVNETKNVVVSYKKIPFTITVKDTENATINPNMVVNVNYGDDKEFTIKANAGYKIVKVLVDGFDKTADMVGDKLTLKNITSNMELEVVVERITYQVVEGNNQKYILDKSTEARFKINADFSMFDGRVFVDDVLLDDSKYQAESGSTVIILNKEFVDTLENKEHTLKVLFNDGGFAEARFTVAKVGQEISNPKTGDNLLFYILVAIVSVLGLVITSLFVYKRKQQN